MKFKPATITKGSFAFCRATIAILLWAGILGGQKWLVVIVGLLMLLSAITKVAKAPLIMLYQNTMDRFKPSETIIVDERGIYVSHVTGTVFSVLCIVLLYANTGLVGWGVTVLFAILQTSAAFGFCSALKLYNCMNSGNCCRIGKRIKKVQDRV